MKFEIESLQKLMAQKGLDAYVVFTQDAHQSEYVAPYWKVREFLTGFTGSAGTLVVTSKEARLWTDGRYFLQAQSQLEGTGIELMRDGEPGVPTWEKWIRENLEKGAKVGMDGRTLSMAEAKRLTAVWGTKEIQLSVSEDLAGSLWQDRPVLPQETLFELPAEFAGETRQSRLGRIQERLEKIGADSYLVCTLESVAWMLNLRGKDVRYTPVFYAYLWADKNSARLYVEENKVPESIRAALTKDNVELRPYAALAEDLKKAEGKIAYDPGKISVRLSEAIPAKVQRVEEREAPMLWRSIKNNVEQANFQTAHIKDGVAMVQFIVWVKNAVQEKEITECEAAEYLSKLRGVQEDALGDSFGAIVAYGKNAAIVHYDPEEGENSVLKPEGFLLVDSGGHYKQGTTDITRTISLGKVSLKQRKAYTLVLKGHIDLANAVFPDNTPGQRLDICAREPLWREGLDYRHGTGHGVGYVLSVHEGPQNIGPNQLNDGFHAGMVTSDEPGYYEAGEYGIRIENLLLCKEKKIGNGKKENPWGRFLEFETLTLCPYEREAILPWLLTKEEKKWLNAYFRRLRKVLSPKLNKMEKAYLRRATRPF